MEYSTSIMIAWLGATPCTMDTTEAKPFIHKLYTMVSEPETAHIFDWSTDGNAIELLDLEAFVSELLPVYFKHGNLSSFVRQLNTYGFSKTSSDAWRFSHPEFRQGHPERLHLIQRKSSHRPSGSGAGHELATHKSTDLGSDATAAAEPLVIRSLAAPQPAGSDTTAAAFASTDHGGGAVAQELSTLRVQSEAMMSRIVQLSQQMRETVAKQADTRESIGKIMGFLSQVYHMRGGTAGQARASPGSVEG